MKSELYPSKDLTTSFSEDLNEEKVNSSRIIALLGALLFSVYTVMDCFGLPDETLSIILPLRLAIIIMLLTIFYLTYKSIFQREYVRLHLFAYYACGIAIAIGTYQSQPGEYSHNLYCAAFIILFMTCFSWSYLPIKHSLLMSIVFITVYACIKVFIHKFTQGAELLTLISHLFYLSSVVVIAAIAQSIRDSLIFRNLLLQNDLKLVVNKKLKKQTSISI